MDEKVGILRFGILSNFGIIGGWKEEDEFRNMAMPWSITIWLANLIWTALSGWVVSCLSVADEIASSLRNGDIGPFHVG